MFKSDRLAELAPGVFLPEYPQIIKPRQKLIPTLARILASFRRQHSDGDELLEPNDDKHTHSNNAEWYEEKLWSSMVSALRMPTRTRFAKAAASTPATGPDHEIRSVAHDAREEYENGEKSFRVSTGEQEFAFESHDSLHWLPLLEDEAVASEELLELSSAEYSDSDSFLLDASASDEESFQNCSQDVSAEIHSRAHFDLTDLREMGMISRKRSHVEVTRHADLPRGALTHTDQKGKENMQSFEDREKRGMIGQPLLTHVATSTRLHEDSEVNEMDDDILIPQYFQASVPCSKSVAAAIEHYNNKDQGFLFQDGRLSITPGTGGYQLDTDKIEQTFGMPSHSPRQSLSEVLGSDPLLWNLWKRRGSAASPAGDQMLEMHNMFENDPDMRLLTSKGEDHSSYDDSMLFESFEFSRKSTQSSESSWAASPSKEMFEQPLEDPMLCSQPTQSSTQPRTSVSSPKKGKRRPSVLQKITRPPKLSEDDILFQQSSPTRQVDIKKRKSLLDYHRGE